MQKAKNMYLTEHPLLEMPSTMYFRQEGILKLKTFLILAFSSDTKMTYNV